MLCTVFASASDLLVPHQGVPRQLCNHHFSSHSVLLGDADGDDFVSTCTHPVSFARFTLSHTLVAAYRETKVCLDICSQISNITYSLVPWIRVHIFLFRTCLRNQTTNPKLCLFLSNQLQNKSSLMWQVWIELISLTLLKQPCF